MWSGGMSSYRTDNTPFQSISPDSWRLTHHVHILEMNGESYRLRQSKRKRAQASNS
jgi:hypothetical protein